MEEVINQKYSGDAMNDKDITLREIKRVMSVRIEIQEGREGNGYQIVQRGHVLSGVGEFLYGALLSGRLA